MSITRYQCTALFLFTLACTPAGAHNDPAYSHDRSIGYRNTDWMKYVDDGKHIRDLTLPGTHNSMALHGTDSAKTQTMSLQTQLEAGIRAFDIRLRHINDSFAIHHGQVYQHANFNDVLSTMRDFLQRYPSETLLVRVKEEHTPTGNSRPFGDTFRAYADSYSAVIWRGHDTDPTLRETRGKIVFLQDFSGGSVGLSYRSFSTQDDYALGSNWDLYGKWKKIENQLWSAANGQRSSINYLTGNYGAFPYFVASGHTSPGTGASRLATGYTTPGFKSKYPDFPRVNCFIGICTIAFEGTNTLTRDYLGWLFHWYYGRIEYAGIIYADFPGRALIENTLIFNLRDCLDWSSTDIGKAGNVYRYENPYSGQREYFRLKRDGKYWYFPIDQTSNADWDFLGTGAKCGRREPRAPSGSGSATVHPAQPAFDAG